MVLLSRVLPEAQSCSRATAAKAARLSRRPNSSRDQITPGAMKYGEAACSGSEKAPGTALAGFGIKPEFDFGGILGKFGGMHSVSWHAVPLARSDTTGFPVNSEQ